MSAFYVQPPKRGYGGNKTDHFAEDAADAQVDAIIGKPTRGIDQAAQTNNTGIAFRKTDGYDNRAD